MSDPLYQFTDRLVLVPDSLLTDPELEELHPFHGAGGGLPRDRGEA
jgi:hypothetical protein